MLVGKNFFDPFSLCVQKKFLSPVKNKIRARDYKKKIIDTAKNLKKIIVHVENGPPPPHHFSNGPS